MKKFLVLMILLAGVAYTLPLGYEHTASNRTISKLKVWTEMPIDF